jgi:hypothetical protein
VTRGDEETVAPGEVLVSEHPVSDEKTRSGPEDRRRHVCFRLVLVHQVCDGKEGLSAEQPDRTEDMNIAGGIPPVLPHPLGCREAGASHGDGQEICGKKVGIDIEVALVAAENLVVVETEDVRQTEPSDRRIVGERLAKFSRALSDPGPIDRLEP